MVNFVNYKPFQAVLMTAVLLIATSFSIQTANAANTVICAGASTMAREWLPTWNASGGRNRNNVHYEEEIRGYSGLCDRGMLARHTNARVINIARAGANAEKILRSDPQPILPPGHSAQSPGYRQVLGTLRKLDRQNRLRPGRDKAIVILGITNDPNPINASNYAVTVIQRARELYGDRVRFLVEKFPDWEQVDFARQRTYPENRSTLGTYWGLAVSRVPVPPQRGLEIVSNIYLANLRGQPGVEGVTTVYRGANPDRYTLDGVHLTPNRMRVAARAIGRRLNDMFLTD